MIIILEKACLVSILVPNEKDKLSNKALSRLISMHLFGLMGGGNHTIDFIFGPFFSIFFKGFLTDKIDVTCG